MFQFSIFGIVIHCRGRICYLMSDLNLRQALLHSAGVGKGPYVHLYCIKLPQSI